MAKAWITDRWVKDATVTMPDGSTTRISPTSAQLKSLKTLPEHFRTAKFGKGSRWVAGWYEPDGAQRQKLFARRTDAEAFTAELEDDIRSARYLDPASRNRRFRDIAEAWLASKKRLKDSSWFRYRRELDRYVLPMWGDRTIGSITRSDIDAWVTQLCEGKAPHVFDVNNHIKKKARTPTPMAPSYLRHVAAATFGGVLRYGVHEKLIGANPMERVELPRDEGNLETDLPQLSYVDIETLADAAIDLTGEQTDGVLIQTLSSSGPRIGEATALKIKDLDLPGKRARVHRTWTIDREGRRKLGPVKMWEKRWLPLADFVVEGMAAITAGRDPEDFVFLSARGAAVDGRNWRNRIWNKVRDATGLAPTMSVHNLRHVAATNAIAAGADPKLVQRMLGHKDANETLNTYSHLWPDRVDQVIMKVEKLRRKAIRASLAEAA